MDKRILILLLVVITNSCGINQTKSFSHELIEKETDALFEKVVLIRRHLHQYPELAGNEIKTKEYIEDYLTELGVDIVPDVYGHGVVGVVKGSKEGRNIAWRADMDALPHDFPEDVDFQSKNQGVQHGCGHDVHMAIGLGMAAIFSKYNDSFYGKVYFIFQPEEESFIGAKGMVEQELISELEIDEIYALHVTALPVGSVMVKSHEMYAYQKRVQIRLKKEISEADQEMLYTLVRDQMTRLKDDGKPWEIQNAFDPEIGLTNPNTIFSDYRFMEERPVRTLEADALMLSAYLYETNQNKVSEILPKITQIIQESEFKDLLHSVSFVQENPTVINDDDLTISSMQTLSGLYGDRLLLPDYGQIPYFNDDFCYFQQKIPGVYFLLGGSNNEEGMIAMNHAPDFQVDEECMRVGIKSFSSLILERLLANK